MREHEHPQVGGVTTAETEATPKSPQHAAAMKEWRQVQAAELAAPKEVLLLQAGWSDAAPAIKKLYTDLGAHVTTPDPQLASAAACLTYLRTLAKAGKKFDRVIVIGRGTTDGPIFDEGSESVAHSHDKKAHTEALTHNTIERQIGQSHYMRMTWRENDPNDWEKLAGKLDPKTFDNSTLDDLAQAVVARCLTPKILQAMRDEGFDADTLQAVQGRFASSVFLGNPKMQAFMRKHGLPTFEAGVGPTTDLATFRQLVGKLMSPAGFAYFGTFNSAVQASGGGDSFARATADAANVQVAGIYGDNDAKATSKHLRQLEAHQHAEVVLYGPEGQVLPWTEVGK